MTTSDYLFDSLLVLLVVRQIRESRLDTPALLLPFGIMAAVGHAYLKSIPTGGHDLLLVAGLALVGVTFGAASALATKVRSDGGRHALVQAGWVAAGTWVASMGARFAFAVWASHGGGPVLYRFSLEHHLDADAWTAALVLMAFAEVLARMGILFVRSRRVLAAGSAGRPELVTA
jgi:hypothetical protein